MDEEVWVVNEWGKPESVYNIPNHAIDMMTAYTGEDRDRIAAFINAILAGEHDSLLGYTPVSDEEVDEVVNSITQTLRERNER